MLKKLMLISLILNTFLVHASLIENEAGFFTVTKSTVREVTAEALDNEQSSLIIEKSKVNFDTFGKFYQVDPLDKVGQVIGVARDLVALGEDIYRLVIKGKPTATSSYAPISIIPKVNGAPVELFDTENWRFPVKKTYERSWENLYGITVAYFRYSVIYSYGGRYNGKGAYITSLQVVPEAVNTLFGFDFTANMKLGGFQNQGTKANPMAGATILMDYTVGSVLDTRAYVDSFFIQGDGFFKKL